VINDGGAFNHYQIGWMTSMDRGDKLLISARVQYNKQLPGAAEEEGALFVFDVKEQKIVAKYAPLPKVLNLLAAVQTGPSEVVGLGQLESGSSILYRLNVQTGKTELTRTYKAVLCGTAEGDMAVPVRSNGFVVGPEGWVWTGATDANTDTTVVRFNPRDLSCEPVGKTLKDQYNQLLFSRGDLYTTGGSSVQRISNWRGPAGKN
jgi:hypothetical protein